MDEAMSLHHAAIRALAAQSQGYVSHTEGDVSSTAIQSSAQRAPSPVHHDEILVVIQTATP